MLKHIIFTALSISLLTACGKKEEEKNGLDYCNDVCRKASKCEGILVDPAEYRELCEDGCEEAEEAAKEARCKGDFDDLAKCGDRNFECEPDEPTCESQVEDYVECLSDAE